MVTDLPSNCGGNWAASAIDGIDNKPLLRNTFDTFEMRFCIISCPRIVSVKKNERHLPKNILPFTAGGHLALYPYGPPNTFPDMIEQLGVEVWIDTTSKRRPLRTLLWRIGPEPPSRPKITRALQLP
jgi:hypothetical protein